MAERSGAPILGPSTPQKVNPWIIMIAVIVMACCFRVGAIGLLLAFGELILNELGLIHTRLSTLMI